MAKSHEYLIDLGDIYLMKENCKNDSYCGQNEDGFLALQNQVEEFKNNNFEKIKQNYRIIKIRRI